MRASAVWKKAVWLQPYCNEYKDDLISYGFGSGRLRVFNIMYPVFREKHYVEFSTNTSTECVADWQMFITFHTEFMTEQDLELLVETMNILQLRQELGQ